MAKRAGGTKTAKKPPRRGARQRPTAPIPEFQPRRFAVHPPNTISDAAPNWIDIPTVRGDGSFDLSEVISAPAVQEIENQGAISFHALGDSGRGANTEQQQVAEAMARDIDHSRPATSPAFLCHLGDIIYGPDKQAHYPERFYRPYADYHNAIVAIPGNHDGDLDRLAAYLDNFCQPPGNQPAWAQRHRRFMPNQPGAYWRLKAPFVDVIGLFSNADENLGVLTSGGNRPNIQVDWLQTTLKTIAADRSKTGARKALIFATHHPPYNRGLQHGGSGHPGNPKLLAQLDTACQAAGIWPDAVLSGHSHNYQRYMRSILVGGHPRIVPYIVAGTGGIGLQEVSTAIGTRDNDVTYVAGIKSFGYLTVQVSASQLRISFTQQEDSHRAPMQIVIIDLLSGQLLA